MVGGELRRWSEQSERNATSLSRDRVGPNKMTDDTLGKSSTSMKEKM